ncbi:MAG: hypothetical protein RL662_1994 [Bacteroidota bacterium]|jgi:uncharacterized protein
MMSDAWCCFFKDNNFLIGISVDGSQDCHNKYRTGANNEPTFDKTMKGLEFYKHVVPYIEFMKNELENERPPANVVDLHIV